MPGELALLAGLVTRIADGAGLRKICIQVQGTRLHLARVDTIRTQLAHVVHARSIVSLGGAGHRVGRSRIHAGSVAVILRGLELVVERAKRRAVHAGAGGVRIGVSADLRSERALKTRGYRTILPCLTGCPVELVLAGGLRHIADTRATRLLGRRIWSCGYTTAAEAH